MCKCSTLTSVISVCYSSFATMSRDLDPKLSLPGRQERFSVRFPLPERPGWSWHLLHCCRIPPTAAGCCHPCSPHRSLYQSSREEVWKLVAPSITRSFRTPSGNFGCLLHSTWRHRWTSQESSPPSDSYGVVERIELLPCPELQVPRLAVVSVVTIACFAWSCRIPSSLWLPSIYRHVP